MDDGGEFIVEGESEREAKRERNKGKAKGIEVRRWSI